MARRKERQRETIFDDPERDHLRARGWFSCTLGSVEFWKKPGMDGWRTRAEAVELEKASERAAGEADAHP